MKEKTIFISKKYANDFNNDKYKCVYEFKTARSTMQGGSACGKTEKLFMVV